MEWLLIIHHDAAVQMAVEWLCQLVLLRRWRWSGCVSRVVAVGVAHVVLEQQYQL